MARFFTAFAVLGVICLAPAGAALGQGAESLSVSLTDYAFSPATLSLKAGTAYSLHLANAGSKDHDFSAPEFFAAAQVAPEDQGKIKNGTVAVDSGKAVDITVTPQRPGTYSLKCTHFMHSSMGMHGTITVQ